MSRSTTTRWHLFFQILDVSLSVVSGLVLIPLYLQFMSTETYGAWLATGNILIWITAVDPGLTAVIEQRVASAYGANDHRRVLSYMSAGFIITCLVTAGVLAVGLLVAPFVTPLIQLSASVDPALIESAFRLAVIGSTLMIFSFGLYGMSKGLQGTLESGAVVVSSKVVSIATVIVLLYQGAGLMAIPWGKVAGGCVLAVGNAMYLSWHLARRVDLSIRHDWFGETASLARLMAFNFFGRAGNVISNNVDSFIIGRYIGSEVVPMYRLTKKAPDLVQMLINRATVAFTPATSHIAGEGKIDRARTVLLRLVQIILWGLGLMLGGMLVFNDDFVRLWVGPELYAGALLNGLICLLLCVLVLTKSLSNLCYALGNIEGNSIASGIQSIFYILAAWVGADYFGLVGLVVGVILSNLVVALWYYPYVFGKILRVNVTDVQAVGIELVKSGVCVGLAIGVCSTLVPENWGQFVLYVLSFCFLYAICLASISARVREEVQRGLERVPLKRSF